MLGAYFNPIHSNKQKVEESIIKFKNHLKYAKQLNCKYVGSETGSKNDDKWTYHPLNQSEESYQEVLRIFKELAAYAEEQNVYTCIEGAFGHVINTPKQLRKLVDEINSDNVRVIVDLYNYLSIDNHENRYEIFKEALELLKEDAYLTYHNKLAENEGKEKYESYDALMDALVAEKIAEIKKAHYSLNVINLIVSVDTNYDGSYDNNYVNEKGADRKADDVWTDKLEELAVELAELMYAKAPETLKDTLANQLT